MADTVLPDPTTYGTVVHRLLLAVEDSTDPDRNPDAGTPENPTVTFMPPKDWVNYPDGVPDPFTLRPQNIVCDYDAQGYLRHVPPGTDPQDPIDNPEDYRGVRLVATNNPKANPHGNPYQVVYRDGEYKKVGYIHVPGDTTVDLAVDMAQDGGGGVWIQVGPPTIPGPSVPSYSDLPGGADPGDAHMTEDTGHLWIWDGEAWYDAGQWQGPVGIDWRGTWSSSTTYLTFDTVHYNGSAWIAKQETKGNTPSEGSSYWDLLARRGVDGSGAVSSVSRGGGEVAVPDLSGNVDLPKLSAVEVVDAIYQARLDALAPGGAVLTESGSTDPLPGFTTTGPRILYAVYDRLATQSDSWYPVATLGAMTYDPGASGPLIALTNGTQKSDIYLRIARPTTTAYNDSLGATMTPGRYASAVWMAADQVTFGLETFGIGHATFDQSPAVDMAASPTLYLAADTDGYLDNLVAVAVPAEHDEPTRTAIMQLLLDWANARDAIMGNVPSGGTTGQALVKASDDDYRVEWSDVAQAGDLATVATSGSYDDLSDTPTIPSSAGDVGAADKAATMVVVSHGSNASTARPTGVGAVYWIGTVEPSNAAAGDLWVS